MIIDGDDMHRLVKYLKTPRDENEPGEQLVIEAHRRAHGCTCEGWDSKRLIGNVRESFRNFSRRRKLSGQDLEWIAYYNGWIEGRGDMLMQMEMEKDVVGDKEDG